MLFQYSLGAYFIFLQKILPDNFPFAVEISIFHLKEVLEKVDTPLTAGKHKEHSSKARDRNKEESDLLTCSLSV
jgi:hypothetical protein